MPSTIYKYDIALAEEQKLIVPGCEASLCEPVQRSGQYRCQQGHSHQAGWDNGQVWVSDVGWDPQFRAALEDAEMEISRFPGEAGYERAVAPGLIRRGYGSVCQREG